MCGRIVKVLGRDTHEPDYDERPRDPQGRLFVTSLVAADAAAGGERGFNVAPTEQVSFAYAGPSGEPLGAVGRWGLQPHWVRDPKGFKANLFNARAESAAAKPAFRDALKSHRCVVVVDGFYEWQVVEDGPKQPWFVSGSGGSPLLLGGLWAHHDWGDSFTVLTTAPNSLMESLHDRMPVVLSPHDVPRWLDVELRDPAGVADLLEPSPSEWLDAHPVSRAVNDVRNDGPYLIEPVGLPPAG